jgi:hypothetical protein
MVLLKENEAAIPQTENPQAYWNRPDLDSAAKQSELARAKEKPWAQSAMGAAKEKSKPETASRELHSEINQHRTNNWLLHLLCDGKSNQREEHPSSRPGALGRRFLLASGELEPCGGKILEAKN